MARDASKRRAVRVRIPGVRRAVRPPGIVRRAAGPAEQATGSCAPRAFGVMPPALEPGVFECRAGLRVHTHSAHPHFARVSVPLLANGMLGNSHCAIERMIDFVMWRSAFGNWLIIGQSAKQCFHKLCPTAITLLLYITRTNQCRCVEAGMVFIISHANPRN